MRVARRARADTETESKPAFLEGNPVSKVGAAGAALGLGLLLALSSCRQGNRPTPPAADVTRPSQKPNIILLTVDTLRADHMALYGYARDTMPAIGRFARTAVVFDNAVVPRGSTRPSYASMLTGLYPFHHGVRSNATVLHNDLTTLSETLKSAGYHTAGFVSNFVLLGEMSGFGQGFDVYDDRMEERESGRPNYERTARNTLEAILAWLNADPPQPFFLFTNFIDPHGPYQPPGRFGKLYRSGKMRRLDPNDIPAYQLVEGQLNYFDYVDRYDGEIRYTDEVMGILIDELKRKGLWDDALVVFTADHGESMGEHGIYFEHHLQVYEETMHVPLAIRLPDALGSPHGPTTTQGDGGPRRVRSLCSPMDLPPTILAAIDLSTEAELDGRSLLTLMQGGQDEDRALWLEFPDVATPQESLPDIYAIRTATHKLMRILAPNTTKVLQQAVFDLAADRLEQRVIPFNAQDPLHRQLAKQFDSMLTRVHRYDVPFALTVYEMPMSQRPGFIDARREKGKTIVKPLTTDQIERLRGLGYVQ